MITVKMKKILESVPGLTPLLTDKELPISLRHKLMKISKEIKEFEEIRSEKVIQYGKEVEEISKNEKGEEVKNKFTKVTDDNMAAFSKEIDDMHQEEISINCNKIKLRELDKSKLNSMELAFIDWLIDDSEEAA